MTRARDIANNWAADITAVSAGVGITGGGTSGAVTVTNEMATTIDAKGDLVVGSGADAFVRVPVGSNNQVLTADSATTSGVKWATADALPSQTGNSGKYLTTNGTTASWGTVNQPITWTRRQTSINPLQAFAYSGSVYVGVGDGGTLYSSSDGITWTSRTSGFGSNGIRTVHWASGLSLFIAGGVNGTITTSPDGTTWTARTSNMGTNAIRHIHSSGTTVVAVGDGGGTTNTGGITYSTDGITWTRKNQSLSVGPNYRAITYNGTNWIIVSTFSTNNYLYASTPSGTWTAAEDPNGAMFGIFYDGTRMITNDASAYYYYTGTTLTGGTLMYDVQTAVDFSSAMMGLHSLYNGRIYAAGLNTFDFSTSGSGQFSGGANYTGFTPGVVRVSDYTLGGYFVGAAGRIIWSRYAIYTSF